MSECDEARAKLEAAGNKLSGLKETKSNMNERMSALSDSFADFERRIVDGSGLVVTHDGEVTSTTSALEVARSASNEAEAKHVLAHEALARFNRGEGSKYEGETNEAPLVKRDEEDARKLAVKLKEEIGAKETAVSGAEGRLEKSKNHLQSLRDEQNGVKDKQSTLRNEMSMLDDAISEASSAVSSAEAAVNAAC